MVQTMKTLVWICYFIFFIDSYSFAQSKKTPFFSREITFNDTLTLGVLNHYIEKVPTHRVVHLSMAVVQDTIFYQVEAIATFEAITESFKPFFVFKHKGYFFLVDNGLGKLMQGNEAFAKYLTKKLKKYLVPQQTSKKVSKDLIETSLLAFAPPALLVTFSKNGVKQIKWNGL